MHPRSFLAALALLVVLGKPARAQDSQAGLWMGTVRLDKVSEPSGALTPTASPFEFRILFHVDAGGKVKLLKDVIVMQRDHDNNAATPAEIVLVTNPALLATFSGVVRRNGKLAGIRYGTAAYHFAGTSKGATGALAAGKAVSFELDCGENDPLNPFRHKFHPDHAKGLTYVRRVAVSFAGSSLTDAPGYGVKRLGGTYKETIENLTSQKIEISGSVTLDRISTVATLTP